MAVSRSLALAERDRVAAGIARARAWEAGARRELVPFAVVASAALVIRVVALTKLPLHHDESEHAWFTWRLVSDAGYHYDPVFHGPVQFYAMAVADLLLGAGDLTARVAPALVGTALTTLPFFLRRQLGYAAALSASVLLCISPSVVYYSRFAREDIYFAFITLALFVAVFRFLGQPRPWHPSLVMGLLAVSFATKETTYISVFVGGSFFVAVVLVERVRARRAGRAARASPLLQRVWYVGRDAWIWGVATFFTVYTLLFTTFFTNPRGLQAGLVDGIRYWLSQQPVNRGSQPWFYYLALLPAYEWPVLLLALVGVAAVLRRPTLLGCFLVWFSIGNLVVYSWASERFPWLVLHPLLPLTLLAGVGAQGVWRARRTPAGGIGIAAAAVGVAYMGQAAYFVNYVRPADPRELLVSVQTSTDVPRVRDRLLHLERRAPVALGRPLTVQVDSWGGTGWPWGWYLRDEPVAYDDMSRPDWVPTGDVLIVADPNRPLVERKLRRYDGRRFRLRVWWLPDWGSASVGEWARWLLSRKPWSPQASLDEWIYVRRDVGSRLARGQVESGGSSSVTSVRSRRSRRSTRSGSGTRRRGATLSAWRTSAYESAVESSTPYAPTTTTVAASKTPSAAGEDGRISARPMPITTSSPASGDNPRSKASMAHQ
jgi:uncharacterized protein (TIGR03663 family)